MCWDILCIGTAALKRCGHFLTSWKLKEASHEIVVFISSTLGIWRKPPTKASFSSLQLLEFEGRLPRKLRFHIFNFWNLKEASHKSFVFMNHRCDLNVRICAKHCVFSGKWSFRCGEKLARAHDSLRRRRFAVKSCSNCAPNVTHGFRWLFASLMMLCYCVLHVFRHSTLCIGTAALKRCGHFLTSWKLKEASHEIVVFISSTLAIWKKPPTKASFSSLQLLEFERSLPRKLRFHIFNFWNLKEASHESFVFMNHGCDLNVRICAKHCVFFG